jgi:hypothetical protein
MSDYEMGYSLVRVYTTSSKTSLVENFKLG